MSNTIKNITEKDNQALLEELENRYGAAVAQAIMDQIEKARLTGQAPDCLLVKALCDMNEMFRGEAQAKAVELRQSRNKWARHGENVMPMDKPALEVEFNKIYRLWWITMKVFHPFYKMALAEAQTPKFPTSFPTRPSGTPLCRALAA